MSIGLMVTGTDTGIGKTTVSSGLLAALRQKGIATAAMKPVETGWTGGPAEWPPDALSLAEAAGIRGACPREMVVPYHFPEPLAPTVAASRVGATVDPAVLDEAYQALGEQHDLVLVESAGGLAVPLRDDLTYAGLAARWHLPLLVVIRPGLGSINHAVLTITYAHQFGLRVLGVIINGYPADPSVAEMTNPGMIQQMTGIPILGILPELSPLTLERITAAVNERLNLAPILRLLQA